MASDLGRILPISFLHPLPLVHNFMKRYPQYPKEV